MNNKRAVRILAAHANQLTNPSQAARPVCVSPQEASELRPLFQLAEALQQTLRPVKPRDDFVRELRIDLLEQARSQTESTQRLQRILAIGAAALGSLISIASVVGAIIFVIRRLHRAHTRTATATPTG